MEALKAELPDILRQFEHAGLTKWRVRRSPSRDDSAAQDRLRGLGVQLCSSCDPDPDQSPQVFFGDASLGGATGPSMIVDAVNENLPNKAGKPVNAKTAGAAEAHLFPWSNSAQQHKRGRAEATSSPSHTGLDGLEPIDLQGIDAVRVAVDAGPSHAPDCRHQWPIPCFDADGWHDWQLRRSPSRRPDPQIEALAAVWLGAEVPSQSRCRHTSPGLTTGSPSLARVVEPELDMKEVATYNDALATYLKSEGLALLPISQ